MDNLTWIKSSYSAGGNGGGNCVEVADLVSGRAVRDSKQPSHGMHAFPRAAWSAFVTGVKREG